MGIMAAVPEFAFWAKAWSRIDDALFEIATRDVLESREIAVYYLFLRCVLFLSVLGGRQGRGREERAGDYEVAFGSAHGTCSAC